MHLFGIVLLLPDYDLTSIILKTPEPVVMGGGTGGYRGYMYPPPFLEGGYKRVHSVKVCVYPVVR